MSQNQLQNIDQLEANLWSAADNLRANSKLTSSEYCMPVLGVIFLRHATNRYDAACRQIAEDQAAGKMPKRPLVKGDFLKRRALMLPKEARYDELLKLPKGSNLGAALVEAMNAIERDFEPLLNQLPKDYDKFESDLLENLLRTFDCEVLRTASGDLFGRIYEYFLMKFAMQGAQDNGEFFTPPSIVQTIVNVIEPDHGIVFDPATGSAGMFVQSSHFIERHGQETSHRVTFFGQEKTGTTIRLAKMNLAVHGLEGDIRDTADVTELLKELHRIVNEAIRAQQPGGDQTGSRLYDLSQIDLEKLRDEFAKKVQRKATALQDIRQIVEQKLAAMLKHNPQRMDYYKRYSEIVADYNREKDRVTIEETFAKVVDLIQSLDAEQRRAAEEGLSEEELALFDLLKKDNLSKTERERVKQASQGLLKSIRELIAPLDRWTEKEKTQAEVQVLILDHLFLSLPTPPFTNAEKEEAARRAFQYVWQQSAGGLEYSPAA